MKKLIAIVAFTASVVATPAFAQSPYQSPYQGFRAGYLLPPYAYERPGIIYDNAAPWQAGFYDYGMVDPWYRNGGIVTGAVQPNH